MTRILPTPAPITAILGARQALNRAAFKYIPNISRRAFIGAVIAISTVVVAALYISEISSARVVSASPVSTTDKVYLGTPAAAVSSSVEKAQMREVHIANNGLVLLRGATVLSNSRGVIRVAMGWDSASFTWRVETDYDTKFYNSAGEQETPGEIEEGDVVTVTGQLAESGTEPIITASFVRE